MLIFGCDRCINLDDFGILEILPSSVSDGLYDIVLNHHVFVCGGYDLDVAYDLFRDICEARSIGCGGFSVVKHLKYPLINRIYHKFIMLLHYSKARIKDYARKN